MSTYGYLQHHGILGQKWGVRRYQNPDGSLTEEGRKRYGYSSSNTSKQNYENLKNNLKDLKKDSKSTYSDYVKSIKKYYEADENVKSDAQQLYNKKVEASNDEYNLKKEALFQDDAHTFVNACKNTEKIANRAENLLDEESREDKAVYFEQIWDAAKYALAEEILKDPKIKKWNDKAYDSKMKYENDVKDYTNKLISNISDQPISELGNIGGIGSITKTSINSIISDIAKNNNVRNLDLANNEYEYLMPSKQDPKVSYLANVIDDEMAGIYPGLGKSSSYLNDKNRDAADKMITDMYFDVEKILKDKGYYIYD